MPPDLIVRQLFDATSSTYTYLIGEPSTRQAVIVDTVFEQHARDLALVRELGLQLVAALDTHCHADHVTGAWRMQQATGCRVGASARYGDALEGADLRLDDGDRVDLGHRHLQVWATPGHTEGCLSFIADDHRFVLTGDALLIRGAGRCDFQQGDAHALYRSITGRLFALPDTCVVYPAHDYAGRTVSTVGEEKAFNPRIGGQADERDFVGFMDNLGLPHPKQLAIALPANLRSGRPEGGPLPPVADWGPVRQTYAGHLEIDPEWVAEHRAELLLLDVRAASEFDGQLGRIEGARCLPLDELAARVHELPRDRPVVCLCHAGARSAQATTLLRQAGFERVANLRGGMLRWRQLGLPLAAAA